MLNNEILKNYLQKKLNFINVTFSLIVSYILAILIMTIFSNHATYSNLKDFYAGVTIYSNYNKYFDYFCFFIYIVLFFIILFFTNFRNIDINKYICRFAGTNIFKIIINISFVLIILSSIIYCLNISILCSYDNHHYGEQFATYWLHAKYGMKYYRDIMLVHGYLDVLPSHLAAKLFGGFNFYNVSCAKNIEIGIFLTINCLISYFVCHFKKLALVLSSGVCCVIFHLSPNLAIFLFFLTYLLLLENIDTKYKFLWNITYYLLSFVSLTYYTSVGSACFIATLPLFFRQFRSNIKYNSIFWGIALLISVLTFHESIFAYFDKAIYYMSSNVYSFGNFLPSKFSLLSFFYMTFILVPILLLPYFILKLLAVEKNNDLKIAYIIIYIVIVILCNLNYSLYRPDSTAHLYRLSTISLPILAIFIPYMLKNNKEMQSFYCVIAILTMFVNYIPYIHINLASHWEEPNLEYYKPISKYVNKIVPVNSTILDLNNNGMNYYYFQRKSATPYVSFYNIVNSRQVNDILIDLKKNPPALVLLYDPAKIILHDNVTVPLRINEVYRWLFLSGLYKLNKKNNALYMEYSPKTYPNLIKQELLDDCNKIAFKGVLDYLPDAWGASKITLPLNEVSQASIINTKIIPEKQISPADANLLYIELGNARKIQNIELSMNNLPDTIKLKSLKNKLLIPIDIYPSWLLEKEISNFEIYSNEPISIKKAELYNRDISRILKHK